MTDQAAMIESRDPNLVKFLTESGLLFRFVDSESARGTLIEGTEDDLLEATKLAQAVGAGIVIYIDGVGSPGQRICSDSTSRQFGSIVEDGVPYPRDSRLLVESVQGGDSSKVEELLEDCIPLALNLRPIDPGFIRALSLIAESEDAEAAEAADWESRDDTGSEEDEESDDNNPEHWEGAGGGFELDDQDVAAIEEAVEGKVGELDPQEKEFLTEIGMIEGEQATPFASEWLEQINNENRESELAEIEETEPEPDSEPGAE